MTYWVLRHNGKYSWDLKFVSSSLNSALDFIDIEMRDKGGQYIIREKGENNE